MARIEIEATESSYTVLPEGSYDIQFDEVKSGQSSNNNPQLQLVGHVVDGPYDGKTVNVFYVLVPKSGWRLRELLEAMGVEHECHEKTLEDGSAGYNLAFDTDDLIGGYTRYDVKIREFDGKERNDFKNASPSPLSGEIVEQAPPAQNAAPAATAPATQPQAAPAGDSSRRRRTVQAPQG